MGHYKIVSGSKKRYIKIADVLNDPKHEQLRDHLDFCMLSAKDQRKKRDEDIKKRAAHKKVLENQATNELFNKELHLFSQRVKRQLPDINKLRKEFEDKEALAALAKMPDCPKSS